VLGRHGRHRVAAPEGESVLVLGGAGAGKSAALCVPAIEEWDGPVVAISRKTDLVEVTAGVRQHLGPVDVLDPGGRTGLATCNWTTVPAHLGFGEAQDSARKRPGSSVLIATAYATSPDVRGESKPRRRHRTARHDPP